MRYFLSLIGVVISTLTLASDWPLAAEGADYTRACLLSDDGRSTPLMLEMAITPESRARGLMHREHLPEDHGMLFVFPDTRPGNAGFWMYNTLIPLDIAFLDADDRILRLLTMQPCGRQNPRQCRTYSPGMPYLSALETNAGYFAKHGLKAGDRLLRNQDCPPATTSTGYPTEPTASGRKNKSPTASANDPD